MTAHRRLIPVCFLLLGLIMGLMTACQKVKAPHADEVTFAVVLPQQASEAESAWRAFLADMASLTGLKIKADFATDDDAALQALHHKRVQAGLFSNTAALSAVRAANAYVIARASDPSAPEGYHSLILVRAGSGLSLEHLMACSGGLRFGMGEATSLAGNRAPLTYLFLPHRADPERCFALIDRSEPDRRLEALLSGQLDATVSNSVALQRFSTNDPQSAARLKVIWTSPLLPDPPLLLRKDLDPATREKLRSFILSYGSGDGPEAERQRGVLARLGLGLFQPADDTHLLPMREMEAAETLMTARQTGTPAGIAEAEQQLRTLTDKRRALAKPAEAPPDPE